jgi:hypothetical protein
MALHDREAGRKWRDENARVMGFGMDFSEADVAQGAIVS